MPIEISSFEKAIENKKKRFLEMPLPDGNGQAIVDFSEFCFTEGLSARRVLKYVYTLAIIAKWLPKKFSEVDRKDIETLINKIERSDYAEWTKHDYKVTVKKFFKWLRQTEDGYPPEVKWICATIKNRRTKLPDEILTPEEVIAMVTAATNARDKALVSSHDC